MKITHVLMAVNDLFAYAEEFSLDDDDSCSTSRWALSRVGRRYVNVVMWYSTPLMGAFSLAYIEGVAVSCGPVAWWGAAATWG